MVYFTYNNFFVDTFGFGTTCNCIIQRIVPTSKYFITIICFYIFFAVIQIFFKTCYRTEINDWFIDSLIGV